MSFERPLKDLSLRQYRVSCTTAISIAYETGFELRPLLGNMIFIFISILVRVRYFIPINKHAIEAINELN